MSKERVVGIVLTMGRGTYESPEEAQALAEQIQDSILYQVWAQHYQTGQTVYVTVNEANIWAEHGESPDVHSLQITFQAESEPWKHRLLLRPPTVDVLTMLTYESEQYVAFVEQFRPAVGARIVSNPAGGKKWHQSWEQAATTEVWEELRLTDYTRLNLADYFSLTSMTSEPREVSPGITNERTQFLRADFTMPSKDELDALVEFLQGKITGVAEDGEVIKVYVARRSEARQWLAYQPRFDLKTDLSLCYAAM